VNPADGKELKTLGSHTKERLRGVFTQSDGKLLASAGADDLVKVFDVASREDIEAD
jgi:WD40 repeat protein